MSAKTMSADTIRRRANGTIDIDFYRAQASAHRSATIRAMAHRAWSVLRTATRVLFAASRRPMPDPGAVMLVAQAAVRRPRL